MREKINGLRERMLGNWLIVAFMAAPFVKPQGLMMVAAWTDAAFMYWRIVVTLFVAAFFLAKPKLSPVTVLLCLYQAVVPIPILLNHTGSSLFSWLYTTVGIGALCLFVEQCIDVSPKALVRGLFGCLGLFGAINLVTVLAFPGGMPNNIGALEHYFLGRDNSHSFFLIPLMTAAALDMWNTRRPLLVQLFVLAVSTAAVYLTWSVSGVVSMTAFVILFLLYRVRGSWRLFNIATYYAVIAAMFLLLVVFRVSERFAPVLQTLFHKSGSLSARVPLWQAVIPYLLDKPVFGNGLCSYEQMEALVGQITCHNMFLQNMFDTGLVGSALFLAALAMPVRPLLRCRASAGGYILAAGLFVFLLVLEVEALAWPLPFYTLLLMCYHAEKVTAALEPEAPSGS